MDTTAGAAAGLAASGATGTGGIISSAGLTRLRAGGAAIENPTPGGAAAAGEASVSLADAGAPADEASPWPDDAAESAFLAEQGAGGNAVGAALPPAGDATPDAPAEDREKVVLPPLQNLVDRLSPGARELLEDLFRAKFVAVRQVPRSVLK
jgi:hypothetical protein